MAADPLDLYFAASESTVTQGLNMARSAFQVFNGGFSEEALNAYLKMVVPSVLNMKMQQARLTSAFLGRRTGNPPVVPNPQSVLQRGTITPNLAEARDMLQRQYVRPFVEGRTALARGGTIPDAMVAGERRLDAMVDTDSQMAKVRQARDSLTDYGVEDYRRVTHSAKPCRLCLLASTQTYHRKNLMPIHPHCVAEGSIVASPTRIHAVTRREFLGELIEFATASGDLMRVTPDHPVLTEKGWIPAGLLSKGDTVFRSRAGEWAVDGRPHVDQAPAPVEDVFAALRVSGTLVRVPFSAEDFHSSGSDGEVDVVWADGDFAPVWDIEHGGELCLMHTQFGGVDLPAGRDLAAVLPIERPAAHRIVGSGDAGLPLLGSHLGHAEPVSLTAATRFDPPGVKFSDESRAAYADRGRALQHRLAGQVEADSVVELRRVGFAGHVFDLQTDEGWFVADNHIVSNCRCSVDVMPEGWSPREIVIPEEYMRSSKDGKRRGGKAVREDDMARWFRDMHDENTESGFNAAFEGLVEVREHGEIGPVLTWKDHAFKEIPAVWASRVIGFEPTVEHGRPSKRAVWGPVQSPAELLQGWYQMHPDIQLVGFHDIQTTNAAQEQMVALRLRDFLTGVDDMIRRYPDLEQEIPRIVWGDCYYGPSVDTAETWPTKFSATTGRFGTDKITLNEGYFLDPDSVRRNQDKWEHEHPLSPWDPQPGTVSAPKTNVDYVVAVHELGHVVSNMGARRAENEVMSAIAEAFRAENPGATQLSASDFRDEMNRFIRENMSGYGRGEFDASGPRSTSTVNAAEALAEAFADVEMNGDRATPINKKLHDRLMARSGQRPAPRVAPDTGGIQYRYGEAPAELKKARASQEKLDKAVSQIGFVPRKAGFNTVDLGVDLGDGVTLYSAPEARRTGPKPKPTPVEWTGPQIAEPSDSIRDNVNLDWQTVQFDEKKALIREGARIAEYEGYRGEGPAILEADYAEWDRRQRAGEITGSFRPSEDGLRAEGKEIVARAVYADPTVQKWYRGIAVLPEDAAKIKAGDTLSMQLSSFAGENWTASEFARGNAWRSKDVPEGKTRGVVFVLEPGAKLAGMPGERVGFGQFEVERVDRSSQLPGSDLVYIRQTSMLEKSVARPDAGMVTQKYPAIADLEADVYEAVRKNGGVTIDLGGKEPTSGYAYAPYKDTEVVVPQKEWTVEHLDQFIDDHFDDLKKPGNNLGLWVEDGQVYMDISRVGPASAATIAKAQRADQLAVFDLKNFQQIDIGTLDPTGKYRKANEAATIHTRYLEQVRRASEGRSPASTPAVSGGGAGSDRAGPEPALTQRAAPATAGPREALRPNPQAPQPPPRAAAIVSAMTAEDLAPQDVASLRRFNVEDLSQTVKPVPKMNKDGTFRVTKSGQPTTDWGATWRQAPPIQITLDGQVSDPVLEANYRAVLAQALSHQWAREAGLQWYPEYGEFVARELASSGRTDLTLEQAVNASAAFAINASWNENMANFHLWINGKTPANGDPRFVKADEAARDLDFWHRPGSNAPKIDDFSENGKGDYSRSTTDRWMARVGLGTDDSDLAAGLLGAGNAGSYVDPDTGETVKLSGYDRLSEAMTRVAKEYGIEPAMAQAMVWIEYFGPEAAYGLPPDDVVAAGLPSLNKWVREQTAQRAGTGDVFQFATDASGRRTMVVVPGIRKPKAEKPVPLPTGRSGDSLKDLLRSRPVRR